MYFPVLKNVTDTLLLNNAREVGELVLSRTSCLSMFLLRGLVTEPLATDCYHLSHCKLRWY
jgi:hypothetical protein